MATTTPNYGWDVPTSSDYVKLGAQAIETLGDDIDATLWTALGGDYPGLRLVKKQTVGTGVSAVTVTDAFSATYESYKIIYTGGTGSTTNVIRLSLAGITTGYYSSLINNSFSSATVSGALFSNQASWNYAGATTTTAATLNLELHNPYATKAKWGRSVYLQVSTTGDSGMGSFSQGLTTSATDFTLTPGSGTLTGGTIYVYGFGAS